MVTMSTINNSVTNYLLIHTNYLLIHTNYLLIHTNVTSMRRCTTM